jgi:GNAT superfamily N-acetyltransferase
LALRLRFLLDTNVLIPLQDSYQVLEPNLTDFVRLAGVGGHQLLYHPATIADFERDPILQRRQMNLQRLVQYSQLDKPAPCPWNMPGITSNDACDNEILYALECDAVHALVTEDKGIHVKARARGLTDRVYTIQMAQDWLRRLHEAKQVVLPNIVDAPLHSLTPSLTTDFFDSLREGYDGFDEWFRRAAREDRRAWVYRDEDGILAALCIYKIQSDEIINNAQERLFGAALKLCTFKVGEKVRGRKIGELFLKAAFRYATENACENLLIHANAERHDYLIRLLVDFGFEERGTYSGDLVLVKRHPHTAPEIQNLAPLDYARRYFPHFRRDNTVQKFIIPILPQYHETLFPDYRPQQGRLFNEQNSVGNAIKLAYLCHSPTNAINPGDILLFYRTHDEKSVTTLGIVDKFKVLQDAAEIASLVSRRTVYNREEIEVMAHKKTKVILFRSVEHFPLLVNYAQLQRDCGIAGPIQSIRQVHDDQFSRVLTAAGW